MSPGRTSDNAFPSHAYRVQPERPLIGCHITRPVSVFLPSVSRSVRSVWPAGIQAPNRSCSACSSFLRNLGMSFRYFLLAPKERVLVRAVRLECSVTFTVTVDGHSRYYGPLRFHLRAIESTAKILFSPQTRENEVICLESDERRAKTYTVFITDQSSHPAYSPQGQIFFFFLRLHFVHSPHLKEKVSY